MPLSVGENESLFGDDAGVAARLAYSIRLPQDHEVLERVDAPRKVTGLLRTLLQSVSLADSLYPQAVIADDFDHDLRLREESVKDLERKREANRLESTLLQSRISALNIDKGALQQELSTTFATIKHYEDLEAKLRIVEVERDEAKRLREKMAAERDDSMKTNKIALTTINDYGLRLSEERDYQTKRVPELLTLAQRLYAYDGLGRGFASCQRAIMEKYPGRFSPDDFKVPPEDKTLELEPLVTEERLLELIRLAEKGSDEDRPADEEVAPKHD